MTGYAFGLDTLLGGITWLGFIVPVVLSSRRIYTPESADFTNNSCKPIYTAFVGSSLSKIIYISMESKDMITIIHTDLPLLLSSRKKYRQNSKILCIFRTVTTLIAILYEQRLQKTW